MLNVFNSDLSGDLRFGSFQNFGRQEYVQALLSLDALASAGQEMLWEALRADLNAAGLQQLHMAFRRCIELVSS